MKKDTDADADYLERIERHFGLRRGGSIVLSPRDWKLVQDWQEKGIPAEVVMRGINRAFDHFAAAGPRPDRINSLSYCRQHVEAAWEEHRELAASAGAGTGPGESGTGSLDDAFDHLRAAAERCREAASSREGTPLAEELESIAAELEKLAARARAGEGGVRDVDAEAVALEERLRQHSPDLFLATDRTAPELPPFSPWAA